MHICRILIGLSGFFEKKKEDINWEKDMLDEIKKSLESKRINGNRYNQISSMQV